MACTSRANKVLTEKFKKLVNVGTPLERLQAQCLCRGATGIKEISRQFKIMDDDGNRRLEFSEFKKGLSDFGVMLTKQEVQELFQQLDVDKSGTVDFDEFLRAIRPNMNNARMSLVLQAFKKLDKTGDGVVTVDDLRGVYSVKRHPKYLCGEKSEDECLREFLDTFEQGSPQKDGVITKDEFISYYSGLSASIDNDLYFDLMMRHAWRL